MIRNFLFHRVNPKRELLWDPMPPELFEKCIAYITRKFKVVLLEDLLAAPDQYARQPTATICFDDGYLDNYTHALPILEKYGCKASFYVVTDCIDFNQMTWTHQLDYRFLNTNRKQIDIQFDFLPSELHIKTLTTRQDRIAYCKRLKPAIKNLPNLQRVQVCDHIRDVLDDVQMPELMMNWDQLAELIQLGHRVGSHSVSHPMLASIEDPEELALELSVSATRIEEKLGHFPKTISYPIGSFNDQVVEQAVAVGYQFGLAVQQRDFSWPEDGLYRVPRVEVYNERWLKTWLRLSGWLPKMKRLLGR